MSEAAASEVRKAEERLKEMRGLAAALVLSGVATVALADPLSTYDDAITAVAVMDECHIVIPGLVNEEKLRATGDAAFQQLGGSAVDPRSGSHHEKDVEADNALKNRTEIDSARGRELVAAKGCPALVSHAREVLKGYRQ